MSPPLSFRGSARLFSRATGHLLTFKNAFRRANVLRRPRGNFTCHVLRRFYHVNANPHLFIRRTYGPLLVMDDSFYYFSVRVLFSFTRFVLRTQQRGHRPRRFSRTSVLFLSILRIQVQVRGAIQRLQQDPIITRRRVRFRRSILRTHGQHSHIIQGTLNSVRSTNHFVQVTPPYVRGGKYHLHRFVRILANGPSSKRQPFSSTDLGQDRSVRFG